jgi:isoleucyl-tRNA synthetase
VRPEWRDPELAGRWEDILKVRAVVNKELEAARRDKIIGAPLDAEVDITASGAAYTLLKKHEAELADMFIVSLVRLTEGDTGSGSPVSATVRACAHAKCPRCWVHAPEVPEDQSTVCNKCADALQNIRA